MSLKWRTSSHNISIVSVPSDIQPEPGSPGSFVSHSNIVLQPLLLLAGSAAPSTWLAVCTGVPGLPATKQLSLGSWLASWLSFWQDCPMTAFSMYTRMLSNAWNVVFMLHRQFQANQAFCWLKSAPSALPSPLTTATTHNHFVNWGDWFWVCLSVERLKVCYFFL